ncbi:MAG TPA: hypothetical protein VLR50_16240 [Desulfobacterales bacterium]|nr:hypothetical protein [Desulfobacterales bacterium]
MAERLGVTVEEHNFREAGVRVVSGLCVVHGKRLFIMDKHKSVQKKVRILSAALSEMPLDEVFIVPAVRNLIVKRADESLQEGG